jgi:ribonuclease BN (tRNA processing enzyme)
MKVRVIGFYGGYPTSDGGTTSYLLESDNYHLLLDVGSGSLIELQKHFDPLALDAVLLTHYHPDHIADLGVLQHVRLLKTDKNGKKAPVLPVYGHDEDEQAFKKTTMEDVTKGISYNHEESVDIGPFTVTYMKTKHPVPTYAFRIVERSTGKVLVFTADSGYLEEFIPFSKEADLLITDTNLFKGQEGHPAHMTSKECGEIAEKAGVKKLMLSHLPQVGDYDQLKKEAEAEVTKTEVLLAEKELVLDI